MKVGMQDKPKLTRVLKETGALMTLAIHYCVFPENIQTPTTEGISIATPPPLQIFHFRMIR